MTYEAGAKPAFLQRMIAGEKAKERPTVVEKRRRDEQEPEAEDEAPLVVNMDPEQPEPSASFTPRPTLTIYLHVLIHCAAQMPAARPPRSLVQHRNPKLRTQTSLQLTPNPRKASHSVQAQHPPHPPPSGNKSRAPKTARKWSSDLGMLRQKRLKLARTASRQRRKRRRPTRPTPTC